MKFDNDELDFQMGRMAMLKFWPASPATQAQIKALIAEMVPNREALVWLVDQLVNHVNEWPGPAELRELLCWKYSPADGVKSRGYCTIPGYTPADGEAIWLSRQADKQQQNQITGESAEIIRQLAKKMPRLQ